MILYFIIKAYTTFKILVISISYILEYTSYRDSYINNKIYTWQERYDSNKYFGIINLIVMVPTFEPINSVVFILSILLHKWIILYQIPIILIFSIIPTKTLLAILKNTHNANIFFLISLANPAAFVIFSRNKLHFFQKKK